MHVVPSGQRSLTAELLPWSRKERCDRDAETVATSSAARRQTRARFIDAVCRIGKQQSNSRTGADNTRHAGAQRAAAQRTQEQGRATSLANDQLAETQSLQASIRLQAAQAVKIVIRASMSSKGTSFTKKQHGQKRADFVRLKARQ